MKLSSHGFALEHFLARRIVAAPPHIAAARKACVLLTPASVSVWLLAALILAFSPAASGAVTVTVSPSVVNLSLGSSQQFTAMVTGAADSSVEWSIQEGPRGGSITSAGLYSAAFSPGQFHVVATSHADPSQSGTATVVIPGFLSFGLITVRTLAGATTLSDGRILISGGLASTGSAKLASAEIYDPASDAYSPVGSMTTGRVNHSATLLPNGQVLVAGGETATGAASSAEVFDPATGVFAATGSLATPRTQHTATLLPNGKVLIAGGGNCISGCVYFATAELYDPATGTFTPTGSMTTGRIGHTATLLPNGKVLIAGGVNVNASAVGLASTEVYDPATGLFTSGPNMSFPREDFTATLLLDGKVLLAGGVTFAVSLSSADLFDPASGTITPTGGLNFPRYYHTATRLLDGRVFVAGGASGSGMPASAELYDPSSGTFTVAAALNFPRFWHTATLLPSGQVLVAGGGIEASEIYDPTTNQFHTRGIHMSVPRSYHTVTSLPGGKVLVAGGIQCVVGCAIYSSAELYDPATEQFSLTGSMLTARQAHTATLLNNGKVLILGGMGGASSPILASAELYDPASGTFASAGNMTAPRVFHTATLLADGRVFIAGGQGPDGILASAEIYDPVAGTFSAAGAMNSQRFWHTATLLLSGKVLIAGGAYDTQPPAQVYVFLKSTELFDPTTGSFTPAPDLPTQLQNQAAVRLNSGEVLFSVGQYASAIYHPATNDFTTSAYFPYDILHYPAVALLPSGRVLIAGGVESDQSTARAGIFDPLTATFAVIDGMRQKRANTGAAALPNGNVLIAGGGDFQTGLSSIEIYQSPAPDPAPVLLSVQPAPLTGFVPLTITLAGSNFLPNAVAVIDSLALDTVYVSSTELTATVPVNPLNIVGPHQIFVSNLGSVSSNSLTIQVMNPFFDFTPKTAPLDFGSVGLGHASQPQQAMIAAGGNVPLNFGAISISGANAADFSIQPDSTCPLAGGTLQPASNCVLNIVFTPGAAGARTAQVSFTNNSTPSPAVVTLTGTGLALPAASLSTQALDFGNQLVGTHVAPKPVTFTNTGFGTLNIASIILNNTLDYSFTDDCGASLQPNASCTLQITFAPSAMGTRSGSLAISDNTADSPHQISLTGVGIAPVASFSAQALNFNPQVVGTTSATQSVTLSNTGTASMSIGGVAITGSNAGDFAITSNTCPAVLNMNAGCGVILSFTPAAVGNRSASLNFTDSAVGSPQSVALNGTGTDVVIGPGTGGSTSTSVASGQMAAYNLQAQPMGGFTGVVNLTVNCSAVPFATTCAANPPSLNLSSAAPVSFAVNVGTTVYSTSSASPALIVPLGLWPRLLLFASWFVLFGLAMFMARTVGGTRGIRHAALLLVVIAGALAFFAGCSGAGGGGGGGGTRGTPPGTYNVVVTETAQGATRTVDLSLTVH